MIRLYDTLQLTSHRTFDIMNYFFAIIPNIQFARIIAILYRITWYKKHIYLWIAESETIIAWFKHKLFTEINFTSQRVKLLKISIIDFATLLIVIKANVLAIVELDGIFSYIQNSHKISPLIFFYVTFYKCTFSLLSFIFYVYKSESKINVIFNINR